LRKSATNARNSCRRSAATHPSRSAASCWTRSFFGTYYPLYSWLGTVTQPDNINYPIAVKSKRPAREAAEA
jgi:hypothetical protein